MPGIDTSLDHRSLTLPPLAGLKKRIRRRKPPWDFLLRCLIYLCLALVLLNVARGRYDYAGAYVFATLLFLHIRHGYRKTGRWSRMDTFFCVVSLACSVGAVFLTVRWA